MKICLVIDDYLPESIKIGAKMMHELACEFVKRGHSVTVVTPSSTISAAFTMEKMDGVDIWRFKSGKIKNTGKIERAINETLLSIRAWSTFAKKFRQDRQDLIVYYSPTIFWGILVKRLKKEWNAPSYLILRDIFPQWAVDRGLIAEGSLIERYFRYFEQISYNSADTIGLMSQKNLEWFKNRNKAKANLQILYNWAAATPTEPTGEYRRELGLEEKTIYFYGGNIGHAQDMMNIVRLAKNMSAHKEAHFLLVGAGDEVDLVKRAVKEHRLQNVTLLPPVDQNEFKKILAEADVGLFTLHKSHKTHNFPGKLLGYMVQSIPILGSVNPGNDLKEIIEEAKAGYITVNGDDKHFYLNALKFLDLNEREKVGKNAFNLLKFSFSVESAAEAILGTDELAI